MTLDLVSGRIIPKTKNNKLNNIKGIPITAPIIVLVKAIPIIKQTKAPSNHELLIK